MNKELLLTDLTSRLRYKTVIYRGEKDYIGQDDALLEGIDVITGLCKLRCLPEGNVFVQDHFSNIIPYLRPMSSMTEEEEQIRISYERDIMSQGFGAVRIYMSRYIDWLDSKHFDWRTDGNNKTLIENGLAVEVTEENNPYKQ